MYDIEYSCFIQIPLTNGQICQPQRPQANYSQVHHLPHQSSVARHPSREQLIDYLMLKVAHQPPYTQSQCSPRQSHELAKQEVRMKSNLTIWHICVSGNELLDCFHLLLLLCRWWQKSYRNLSPAEDSITSVQFHYWNHTFLLVLSSFYFLCGHFTREILTECTRNLNLHLFTDLEIYFSTMLIDHQLIIYLVTEKIQSSSTT